MTREEMQKNVLEVSTWLRGLFMLIYAFFCYIAFNILMIVVLFQFIVVLLSGKPNDKLLYFGDILSTYIYQIIMYLTYNTSIKPFPFGDGITPEDFTILPDEEPPNKNYN
jgi:hypothetical protein